MSSSQSSDNVSEDSNASLAYEIEDENFETKSKDGHESDQSQYAIEDEFRDSMDSFAYTDEPIADESWVEEYVRRQEEQVREMRDLNLRLNGQNPINSWCNCGLCSTEVLVEAKECRCCTEIPKCVDALALANSQQVCITNHPGFDAVCLNRWSLELASDKFKTRSGQKYRQVDSKDRFLRVVAYRQFTLLVHGYLKDKRIPLPACAYHAIRTAFKEKDSNFAGYEDVVEEN